MSTFLQNHPGEQEAIPKPYTGNSNLSYLTFLLFMAIPMGIAYAVLKRLTAIGKTEIWMMYTVLIVLFLLLSALLYAVTRRQLFKNRREQAKYYRLAGGLSWLPAAKREALQLEAHYCYHTGGWVETLEYWPSEIRLPRAVTFTTFKVTTREERLAGNDEAWAVLSEDSYTERVEALFTGMHSRLFAADKQVMTEQNRNAMINRLSELTQLPKQYITGCWEPQDNRPARLLWAFDLQRVVELSRTSFMAGLIGEPQAWEQILKASDYVHALFDNLDDFFDNYRLGHAYWSNDFKKTNEVAQIHKAYNQHCNWPVKKVSWTRQSDHILPELIQNGCNIYVQEQVSKYTHNTIGFRQGNKDGV